MPESPEKGDKFTTSFTFNGIITEVTLTFNGEDWEEKELE